VSVRRADSPSEAQRWFWQVGAAVAQNKPIFSHPLVRGLRQRGPGDSAYTLRGGSGVLNLDW
jgi:hypothetical protein